MYHLCATCLLRCKRLFQEWGKLDVHEFNSFWGKYLSLPLWPPWPPLPNTPLDPARQHEYWDLNKGTWVFFLLFFCLDFFTCNSGEMKALFCKWSRQQPNLHPMSHARLYHTTCSIHHPQLFVEVPNEDRSQASIGILEIGPCFVTISDCLHFIFWLRSAGAKWPPFKWGGNKWVSLYEFLGNSYPILI